MNKRQLKKKKPNTHKEQIKYLQNLNIKQVKARLELSKALNNAVDEAMTYKRMCLDLSEENRKLESELSKPLLSRLWRWNR